MPTSARPERPVLHVLQKNKSMKKISTKEARCQQHIFFQKKK
jgi:hypothetical protein